MNAEAMEAIGGEGAQDMNAQVKVQASVQAASVTKHRDRPPWKHQEEGDGAMQLQCPPQQPEGNFIW